MSNPTGKGSEAQRFQPGQSGNPGGRTPTAWLRELLAAAHDKSPGGRSCREAIADHLIEVATSYEVIVKGRGESALPFADAKDSIEAAKLLMAYDMGKPIEAVELSNPDGSMRGAGTIQVLFTSSPAASPDGVEVKRTDENGKEMPAAPASPSKEPQG